MTKAKDIIKWDIVSVIRPAKAARVIIEQDSGSHFDLVVADAFLRRFDTVVSVQKQIQDSIPVVITA